MDPSTYVRAIDFASGWLDKTEFTFIRICFATCTFLRFIRSFTPFEVLESYQMDAVGRPGKHKERLYVFIAMAFSAELLPKILWWSLVKLSIVTASPLLRDNIEFVTIPTSPKLEEETCNILFRKLYMSTKYSKWIVGGIFVSIHTPKSS